MCGLCGISERSTGCGLPDPPPQLKSESSARTRDILRGYSQKEKLQRIGRGSLNRHSERATETMGAKTVGRDSRGLNGHLLLLTCQDQLPHSFAQRALEAPGLLDLTE